VKNSNILFLVAVLVLGWFGAEVYTAQNICVTSCISLVGMTSWEQGIAVVVLPVLLIAGGFRARQNEKKQKTAVPGAAPS
jgi:membrane protein implicated in regulation of membrane protease activity